MRHFKRKQVIGRMFCLPVLLVALLAGTSGCELDDFQTTTTTTLSGRDVVTYFVRSLILDPIDQYLTDRIDEAFDEDED